MTAKLKLACLAGALFAATSTAALAGASVDAIKARGELICGVNTGLGGFSIANSTGKWVGLDVDVCRAIAAALLGDGNKVKFVPLNAQQRFTALQSGEVDLLSRNTTWTLTRDTQLGLNFAATTYYDGQGFMVPKKLNVTSAKELAGASVCVQPGTTTELNLADYFRANNMQYKPVVIENIAEVNAAFFAGRCDALTTDASRSGIGPQERRQERPTTTSSCPRSSPRSRWAQPWHRATSSGPTSSSGPCSRCSRPRSTASRRPTSKRWPRPPPIRTSSASLAPRPAWARPSASMRIGSSRPSSRSATTARSGRATSTPLGLPRGVNNLWNKGGLMYAPPIR